MNLTGINMFKRHIVEFSKNRENNDLLKMREKSISRENSNIFMFPSQKDAFDDTRSSLQ